MHNGVVAGRWSGMSVIERDLFRQQLSTGGYAQDWLPLEPDPVAVAAENAAEIKRWTEFRKRRLRAKLKMPSTPLPLP